MKGDHHEQNRTGARPSCAGKSRTGYRRGFWFHYPGTLTAEETAAEHIKLFRETDMDIIKIMQDFSYPLTGTITRASDWRHIRFGGTDSKEFEKPKEIISRILDEVGGEALTLMTMFGPL